MSDANPEQMPALPPPTAAVIVLLILLGGAASAMRLATPDHQAPDMALVDLRPPDWRATPAELARLGEIAAARRAAALPADHDFVRPVEAAYLTFNEADAQSTGAQPSTALRDAAADFRVRANELYTFEGAAAFMGLGQQLTDHFVSALESGASVAELRRYGGAFLREGRATGLLGADNRPAPDALPVIRAAFMARWVTAVAPSRPGDTLLSLEERVLLLRWKLAANPLLEEQRQLDAARELRRLDAAYPGDEALAARAADAGKWALAARLYESASRAHPDDPRLRANAAYTRARAEGRGVLEQP